MFELTGFAFVLPPNMGFEEFGVCVPKPLFVDPNVLPPPWPNGADGGAGVDEDCDEFGNEPDPNPNAGGFVGAPVRCVNIFVDEPNNSKTGLAAAGAVVILLLPNNGGADPAFPNNGIAGAGGNTVGFPNDDDDGKFSLVLGGSTPLKFGTDDTVVPKAEGTAGVALLVPKLKVAPVMVGGAAVVCPKTNVGGVVVGTAVWLNILLPSDSPAGRFFFAG
jgi:hypothetical protein